MSLKTLENLPDTHIEKLNIHAKETDALPMVEGKRIVKREIGPLGTNSDLIFIGEGEEGGVYYYELEFEGKTYARILKLMHDPIMDGMNEENEDWVYAMSAPARMTAANARFASRIQGRREIIDLINSRNDILERKYHFGESFQDYQESFIPVLEVLRSRQSVYDLVSLAMKKGSRANPRVLEDGLFRIRENFRGGLGDLINQSLALIKKLSPETQLPEKVLPNFYQFGIFPKDYPNSKFAGKLYLVSDYIPVGLTNVLEERYEELEKNVEGQKQAPSQQNGIQNQRYHQLKQARGITKFFPDEYFKDLTTVMEVFHAHGIGLCDVTENNIGLTPRTNEEGHDILIRDVGAMAGIGKILKIATEDLLPPEVILDFHARRLQVSKALDRYVIEKIIYETRTTYRDVLNQLSSFKEKQDQREKLKHKTLSSLARGK